MHEFTHASVRVRTRARSKLIISAGAEQKEQIKALSRHQGPVETYFNGAGGVDAGRTKACRHLDPRDGGQVGTATSTIDESSHSSFSISLRHS